jgi:hypothetical protein
LIGANLDDVNYYYCVKTSESIEDKIMRFQSKEEQFPVNNWMNDIFGARIQGQGIGTQMMDYIKWFFVSTNKRGT